MPEYNKWYSSARNLQGLPAVLLRSPHSGLIRSKYPVHFAAKSAGFAVLFAAVRSPLKLCRNVRRMPDAQDFPFRSEGSDVFPVLPPVLAMEFRPVSNYRRFRADAH